MEGHQANLALFFNPPVDTATQESYVQEYRPIGQISRGSTLEFNISGSSADMVNVHETRLYLKTKIIKKDGSAITIEDPVAFVNLPHQSLFRQVDCFLQQSQVVSSSTGTYPYRSIFEVLLNYNESAKESHLQSQLFYKDSASMDETNPVDGANSGLRFRWQYTKDNGMVETEGPIFHDICLQKRLILPGVPISFKFYPSRDAFCLMSKHKDMYQVEIVEAVRKCAMSKCHRNV